MIMTTIMAVIITTMMTESGDAHGRVAMMMKD
jgi:hypothetical protein